MRMQKYIYFHFSYFSLIKDYNINCTLMNESICKPMVSVDHTPHSCYNYCLYNQNATPRKFLFNPNPFSNLFPASFNFCFLFSSEAGEPASEFYQFNF